MDLTTLIRAGVLACLTTQLPVHTFYSYRAHRAYDACDSAQARMFLGKCVVRNKYDWRSFVNLGTVAYNDQDYRDAIKHFDAALTINPTCNEARERRDSAQKLLEQQEREREQKKQEQAQKEQQQEQAQDQQQPSQQNNDQKTQSSEQNQPERERNNQQGNEQNKDDKQPTKLNNEQNKIDEESQQSTKQEQQKGENQQTHRAEHSRHEEHNVKDSHSQQQRVQVQQSGTKDSDIPLSEQEKRLLHYLEETDKAAQKYMLLRGHETEQNNEHNW